MNKNLFRLEHILESIFKIEELVKIVKDFNTFEKRWIEQDAIIRNFEIIGEASNHISEGIKNEYPKVPWNEMRGMRNFMTHEYFGLQLDTIWDAAVNDIPILKRQIIEICEKLKKK
ncbi:DUF86 domain-containing protein [Galbibacter sp. BG1]|uniref:HepT-like ribonuclease domain-containing protein n=1 Tax=Galbibacter sp. BG1 TaxID=1170699 RepID=UPI0015C0E5D0|nr:DUF86 domain-containing protein [Galbibacter sp. BG1]QLE00368.1 DUF86 domain-containing protein [Galbibacter sp. BG1]